MELFGQRRFVGVDRLQRFGELLLVQARGLFLELHFGDLVALRLQAALGLHARFLGAAQLLRDLVELMARIGQRALLAGAAVEQVLQAVVGGARFERFQLLLAELDALADLRRLLGGGGDIAAQFLDLAAL